MFDYGPVETANKSNTIKEADFLVPLSKVTKQEGMVINDA